jgi:pteridine reductase
MRLSGQVALVTGAARRLGRAVALALAQEGADVVLHVHTSSGEEIAREVRDLGRRAWVVKADLSSPAETVRLSQNVLTFAEQRVDILINNAAVFFPTPLSHLTTQTWHTILHTNLTAPFTLSLLLGRTMRARRRGHIIQLIDWSGIRALPAYLPYCVSKGGLWTLTQALAKVFAPQVQVNGVAPGPVLPPDDYPEEQCQSLGAETPLRRVGQVADVIRAVRFLLTTDGFITGSVYVVDGGWLACAPGGRRTSL